MKPANWPVLEHTLTCFSTIVYSTSYNAIFVVLKAKVSGGKRALNHCLLMSSSQPTLLNPL